VAGVLVFENTRGPRPVAHPTVTTEAS